MRALHFNGSKKECETRTPAALHCGNGRLLQHAGRNGTIAQAWQ